MSTKHIERLKRISDVQMGSQRVMPMTIVCGEMATNTSTLASTSTLALAGASDFPLHLLFFSYVCFHIDFIHRMM